MLKSFIRTKFVMFDLTGQGVVVQICQNNDDLDE